MSLRARLGYLRSSAAYQRRPARTLLRVGAWRLWTAAGIPQTISLEPWDVRLWLPAQWRGVSKIVYAFREDYEPELHLLASLLRSGDTFVDAGASIGVYSLVASRIVGHEGKVFAFEPSASTRATLERNIASNGIRNVRVFREALSDTTGSDRLKHHPDSSRNALLSRDENDDGSEPIEKASLDEILPADDRSRVSLMKLDIEGAEELALRGATAVLDEAAPHVIFEVNPEAAARLSLPPDGAWRLLAQRGYSFYRADPSGCLCPLDHPPPGGNVVAMHPSRRPALSLG